MIKKFILFLYKNKKIIAVLTLCSALVVTISTSSIYEKSIKLSKFAMDRLLPIGKNFSEKLLPVIAEAGPATSKEQQRIKGLENENAALRRQLILNTLNKDKLERLEKLKASLKFTDNEANPKIISSRIVARNSGRYITSFTVSAGSDNGISQNAIAVSDKGLIGRVFEVSSRYSKIISLLDNRAPVSFKILGKDEITGVISNDIRIEGEKKEQANLINGYTFNINSPIKENDIVITSGMGAFPEGIPIGRVKVILEDKQDLLKYVIIEPFADFESIEEVMIINLSGEQQ